MKNTKLLVLIPVMFAFFVMGFVDLVGIVTNYAKADFELTDTIANILPSMVFLWFFVFSIPTGLLMNKIGRRKTVMLSLLITFLSMIVPLVSYNLTVLLIALSFLGIGNTLMQVSLNPLVMDVVTGKKLASSLTLGQFFKAIASFLAPIIASWAAVSFGNWKLLFPIFAVISLIPAAWLFITKIEEKPVENKTTSFKDCVALLGNGSILLLFVGILVHVGIDVGVNITAPKILMERTGMLLEDASYAISLYFLFKTIGCFSGAFILSKISIYKFYIISIVLLGAGVAGLLIFGTTTAMYVCIALAGLGNSNIFSMIFSKAMLYMPSRSNEISGLMIMGVSGGAIFPLLMGISSDAMNSQTGAVIVIALCTLYLAVILPKLKE